MRVQAYRIRTLVFLSLLISSLLFAAGNQEVASQEELPIVAVSILPQAYFIDQLAGDLVQTVVLVGEGQSPHSYEPSPSQMAMLAKADVWILSGTDFELTLKDKVANLYPNLTIVDGTKGMELRQLEEHDHEDEELHDENGLNIDRHTWLGWQQAKTMIETSKQALVQQVGLPSLDLEARKADLLGRIDMLFESLTEKLAPQKGTTVFVYHPAFGYFLDSFGIEQEAVETGGKEPTAKDLANLIALAKQEGATVLFVQKQFPTASARTVAEAVGAQVVALDPLAYDWMANIQAMGEALVEAGKTNE